MIKNIVTFTAKDEDFEPIITGLITFGIPILECRSYPEKRQHNITIETTYPSIVGNFIDWYDYYLTIGGIKNDRKPIRSSC